MTTQQRLATCPNCRVLVSLDARFCRNCGRALNSDVPRPIADGPRPEETRSLRHAARDAASKLLRVGRS